MGVSQLGYVGVGVSDVAAWEQFATEVLGMEVSGRAPDGTVYLRLDEYHHRVALHPTGDDDMIYAGWGVPNETEFEAMKQRMADGGIEFSQGSQADIANRMVRDM